MKITCYGPRGSLPSPSRKGFSTLEYGGNTSCYYVEAGPFRIVLDNGSGVSSLGDDLMKNLLLPQLKTEGRMGMHFINLISHYHWDHIQGLPFHIPFFLPGNVFHIHGHDPSGYEAGKDKCVEPRTAVERLLSEQQSNPHFPVAHECLPASRKYYGHPRQFSQTFWYIYTAGEYVKTDIEPASQSASVLQITTIPLNHPDGCLGYRIEHLGKVAVYCTDNEPTRHTNIQINKHGKNADWMLLDGQYTEQQLSSSTQAFGHGTPNGCIEQAQECKAKHLIIHHHDPKHDDATVAGMEVDAVAYSDTLLFPKCVEFAREGTTWEIV